MVVVHDITNYINDSEPLGFDQRQGQALGLNPYMWLPAECANFYILERLHHELFPWNGDTRIPRDMYPREYGSDSRLEKLAYRVQITLQDLEAMLADELSSYLVMSVGGELRWAPKKAGIPGGSGLVDCEHMCEGDCCGHDCCGQDWSCCEHHCDAECCAHDCSYYKSPDCHGPMPCGCACNHKHILHPGSGYKACKAGLTGCNVDGCCAHSHNDCHQDCCKHSCSDEDYDCCTHNCGPDCSGERYDPEGILVEFFEATQASTNGRSGAWEVWPKFVEKHGPDVLIAAANIFSEYTWEHGYGTRAWGSAAVFVHAYITGNMSKRAFLDRCWTLQHNSGCIFNKFYQVGEGGKELKYVLDAQHCNDYNEVVLYASAPVRHLWNEYKYIQNRESVIM